MDGLEPERLILRSLAGKSRGRRFGSCLPKFRKRRDFKLHYLPREKKVPGR